jgi:predicted phage terminase large subunit-like protein
MKANVATRAERTQRTDADTISLGYDRFLELLPADTWKFLPHTFASVMSDHLWTPYPYLVMLSNILVTAIARGNGRILISLPPRHGKSWFVSQWLPVWFLSMWPNKRVLLSTYEANFAATWGRRARNIVKDKGSRVGLYLAEDATASNNWETTEKGGMVTAGVGGPITGKGCLTGDTIITTNIGNITIGEYFQKYSLKDNIHCLTYDRTCDRLIFKRIIARRELASHEIYEIDTTQGRKLRLTGGHPIYDRERGYRPARDLARGDGILCIKEVTKEHDVHCVRPTKDNPRIDASGVLYEGATNQVCSRVCALWQGIRAASIRLRKSIKNGMLGRVLLSRMQPGASCCKKLSSILLQGMWGFYWKGKDILQSGMQASILNRPSPKVKRQGVSRMPGCIHPEVQPDNILFAGLQKFGAFIKDVWCGQFALQNRHQLCEAFPGDASVNPRARQLSVCAMWHAGNDGIDKSPNQPRTQQYDHSSLGYQPSKQCCEQSSIALPTLSFDTPPLVRDSIQKITCNCSTEHVVYDIEVEGTHNYFANGVCVKNCDLGIIDDPHKNWQEAQSSTILKSIHEWYDSTFYTRLEPGATIVIMHTRWSENDLIGYLQREKKTDGYFTIRIPALGENLPAQLDTAGNIIVPAEMDVLGRAEGEALCPQRYNVDALNRIKSNMTAQMWNALFQQRPAAQEGSIFLRDKWKYYRIEPRCTFVLQSWDTASKKNWDSAYSVCQTWGVSSAGAVLLDQWRDKVEYPQLRRQAVIQYQKFKPNVVLIEDKDSGQALIQSLQQETTMPVMAITPDMDKITRAQAVSPMQESGRVFLPDPADANHPENLWVSDFVDNCATFPNAFFKDEIDTMSQALAYIMLMATGGRVMSFERRKTSTLLENFRRLM